MQSVPAIMQHSASVLRAILSGDHVALAGMVGLKLPPKISSPTKSKALEALGRARARLVFRQVGRVDTRCDDGDGIWNFLYVLTSTFSTFEVEPVDRGYREGFSINYSVLFREDPRLLRHDILEGCMPGREVWLNGKRYSISEDTEELGKKVLDAFAEVLGMTEHWKCPERGPTTEQMRNALTTLDREWAHFEQVFVHELMGIEDEARLPLQEAIQHHKALQAAEDAARPRAEMLEKRDVLVRSLCRLNANSKHHRSRSSASQALANVDGRGRDDIGADIWLRAEAVLESYNAEEAEGREAGPAGQLIVQGALDAVAALREYLGEAEQRLLRLDPQLRNNQGLAERLLDWERSWEICRRFATNGSALAAVSAFVARLAAAKKKEAALSDMCENKDSELFFVLPRLFLLCYLLEPKVYGRTLSCLLPHHFAQDDSNANEMTPGPDLAQLARQFGAALRALSGPAAGIAADAHGDVAGRGVAWTVLVRSAVRGAPGGGQSLDEAACVRLRTVEERQRAQDALASLMRRLEGASMDLQRRRPQDWNQYTSVVMCCLEGGPMVAKRTSFGVEFEEPPQLPSVDSLPQPVVVEIDRGLFASRGRFEAAAASYDYGLPSSDDIGSSQRFYEL